jgi:hypothetical protein
VPAESDADVIMRFKSALHQLVDVDKRIWEALENVIESVVERPLM